MTWQPQRASTSTREIRKVKSQKTNHKSDFTARQHSILLCYRKKSRFAVLENEIACLLTVTRYTGEDSCTCSRALNKSRVSKSAYGFISVIMRVSSSSRAEKIHAILRALHRAVSLSPVSELRFRYGLTSRPSRVRSFAGFAVLPIGAKTKHYSPSSV